LIKYFNIVDIIRGLSNAQKLFPQGYEKGSGPKGSNQVSGQSVSQLRSEDLPISGA
jgi:hypothetical protein